MLEWELGGRRLLLRLYILFSTQSQSYTHSLAGFSHIYLTLPLIDDLCGDRPWPRMMKNYWLQRRERRKLKYRSVFIIKTEIWKTNWRMVYSMVITLKSWLKNLRLLLLTQKPLTWIPTFYQLLFNDKNSFLLLPRKKYHFMPARKGSSLSSQLLLSLSSQLSWEVL